MDVPFRLVDVFTERPFAGNQLCVVPETPVGTTSEQMQTIAQEIGFSETTFVTSAGGDRYTMRIFTPPQELPFAGHPTLGTAFVLASEGTIELSAIQTTYNLHPLAIDNAMHPLCPPKLEVYNDELYVVAQTAELVGDRISYGKMAIFTGHNHLITVRHGNAGALGKLREQLEASPTQFGKGVDYVLHAILHRVVDQYLPIFEMIEDDVLAMERRSLHDFLGPEEVARIFELRSELTRFQRTLGAMAELVRKLVRGHFPCISAEMTPYFHDVADHVHRVQSMVDGLLLVLSTVFEASSLLEAQRIGVVTRQLAAWAAEANLLAK